MAQKTTKNYIKRANALSILGICGIGASMLTPISVSAQDLAEGALGTYQEFPDTNKSMEYSYLLGKTTTSITAEQASNPNDKPLSLRGGDSIIDSVNPNSVKIHTDSSGKKFLQFEGDAKLNRYFHTNGVNHKVYIIAVNDNDDKDVKIYEASLTDKSSTASSDWGFNLRTQDPFPTAYKKGTDDVLNYFSGTTPNVFYSAGKSFPVWVDRVNYVCGLGIIGAQGGTGTPPVGGQHCNYMYDNTGYTISIPIDDLVPDPSKPVSYSFNIGVVQKGASGKDKVIVKSLDTVEAVKQNAVYTDTTTGETSGTLHFGPASDDYQLKLKHNNVGVSMLITSDYSYQQILTPTYSPYERNMLSNNKYSIVSNNHDYNNPTKNTPANTIPAGTTVFGTTSLAKALGNTGNQSRGFNYLAPGREPRVNSGDLNNFKGGSRWYWQSGNGRNGLYLGMNNYLDMVTWDTSIPNDQKDYISGYSIQVNSPTVFKYNPRTDNKVKLNITHSEVPVLSAGDYDFSHPSVKEQESITTISDNKTVYVPSKGPYGDAVFIKYMRINGGDIISTGANGHWVDMSKYLGGNNNGTISVELFYAPAVEPPVDYIPCQGKACGEIKLESYHNMYLKKFNTDASSGEKPKLVNHYTPMVEVEGDHIFMVDNIKSEITTVSDGNKKYSHSTTDTAYVNNDAINKFVNDKANEVPRYKNIANNLEYPTLVNPAEKVAHKGIVESIRDKYSNIKDVSELNQNKYEEEILSKNKLNSLYKTWLDADSADLRKWNDDNTVSTVWDENFDKEYLDVAYRTDVDYHTDLKVNYVNKGAIRYHYVDVPHHYIDSNGEEQTKWVSTRETYWDPEAYQEYDNTELIGTKHFSKEYEVKGKNPFNVGRTFGNLDKNVESGYSKALVGFESMLDGEKYRAGSTLRKVYEQFGYTDGSVDGEIPTQQAIPIGGKMMYMNPFDVSDMPYKEKANKAHSGIPHMMTSSEVDKVISENNGVFHSDMYYNKNKAKVYFDNVDEEDKAVFSEYRVGNPAATKGDVNKLAMNPLRIPSGVEVSAHSLMSPTGLNYTYSLPVRYSYDLHELKLDGVMAVGQDTGVPAFGNKQDVTAKYKAYYPTRKGNTTKAKAPDELVTVNNGSVLFTPLDTNIGDTIRTRMVVGGVGLSDLTFIDDTYNKVASYLYGRGENTTFSSERSNIEHEDGGIHTGASTLIKSEDLQGSPDVYKVNGVRVGNGPEFNKQVLGGK